VATFVGGAIVLVTLTVHSTLGMRAYHRRSRPGPVSATTTNESVRE